MLLIAIFVVIKVLDPQSPTYNPPNSERYQLIQKKTAPVKSTLPDRIKQEKNGPVFEMESLVWKFINELGDRDFYKAYQKTNNKGWALNGGYEWFKSTRAYGGIHKVSIVEV